MQWSWLKFKTIEIEPKKQKFKIFVTYSRYNEVTQKLENDNHDWTFVDFKLGEDTWDSFIEQLKKQDPAMRYVEDALVAAIKES